MSVDGPGDEAITDILTGARRIGAVGGQVAVATLEQGMPLEMVDIFRNPAHAAVCGCGHPVRYPRHMDAVWRH